MLSTSYMSIDMVISILLMTVQLLLNCSHCTIYGLYSTKLFFCLSTATYCSRCLEVNVIHISVNLDVYLPSTGFAVQIRVPLYYILSHTPKTLMYLPWTCSQRLVSSVWLMKHRETASLQLYGVGGGETPVISLSTVETLHQAIFHTHTMNNKKNTC